MHQFGRKALGAQFLSDAGDAQARRAPVRYRFSRALFADEAFGLQLVQRFRQLAGFGLVRFELAL